MQVDITIPSLQYIVPVSAPQETLQATMVPQNAQRGDSPFGPAVVLRISPEGRAAYEASITGEMNDSGNTSGVAGVEGPEKCQTCENRKYVDVSNDPSVSFQTPTRLSPNEAMFAVAAHEREHVRNEQAKAGSEGRRIVSQSVAVHTSICSECGRAYVSGGETRTVTVADERTENEENQEPDLERYGKIDLFA